MRDVSFELYPGETLALVGESGSGKSVTALSTVRLLPDNAEITGSIRYRGTEMLTADEKTLRRTRGNDISFIFQEPMTSLNPLHTIEKQLGESLALHQGLTGAPARAAHPRPPRPRRHPRPRRTASPPTRTSSPAASASG